jgi:tetratricopeptide (TPR) repeat protein
MTASDVAAGRSAVDTVVGRCTGPVTWLRGAWTPPDDIGVLSADPPDAEHAAFTSVRGLLRQLVPALRDGGHADLLGECGPELREVMPELEPYLPAGPALGDLMQMPLRLARMLPLESELVFRLVARIGWLVEEGARRLGGDPVVYLPLLDEADRPTLTTVYHLAQRAHAGGPRLLLGYRGPTGGQDLFTAVRAALDGPEILLPDPDAGEPLRPGTSPHALVLRTARHALVSGTEALSRWREAVQACGRWFTPEAVLDLATVARGSPHIPPVEWWQATGIAQATMGRFTDARESFQRGYDEARDPIDRARLAMFLALVAAKRQRDAATAEAVVAEGLAAVPESAHTAEAALERGWLLNLKALLAYQSGDHQGALRCTGTAFELMRPHRGEEAVGLKTNLVVNTSIVAESQGDLRRALERWQLFLRIFDRAGDMFAHFYYFRESGLRAKAGDPGALDGYDRVATLARSLSHLPGLIGALRAGTHLAWHAGDPARALDYAQNLPDACRRLGDVGGQRAAWMSVAACRGALGDRRGAEDALVRAADLPPRGEDGLTELRARWRAGEPADWSRWLPALPPTMLRYPTELFLPGRPS